LLISSSVIGVVSVRAASWMSIVPDSEGRMPSQIVSAALAAGVAQIAAVDAGKVGKFGRALHGRIFTRFLRRHRHNRQHFYTRRLRLRPSAYWT
jgi:hypothetical protein